MHGRTAEPVDIHLFGAGNVRIRNGAPPLGEADLSGPRKRFSRGKTRAAGSGLGLSIAERSLAQTRASLVLTVPIHGRVDGFQADVVFSA